MRSKQRIPIGLSLVLVLLTPTISSASLDKLDDIVMSTSTSAGSWSDPLGGGTYLNGGDFTIKLKHSSSSAPLFQFKPPSVKTGCSGISISGGFLQYLGLDQLQDSLSDAGSSLMFGIIMGIEYTLPAIASVFDKIREWANALQALLQNGCAIGQSLTKGSPMAKSFRDNALNTAVEGTFKEMDKFINKGKPYLDRLKKLSECTGTVGDINCIDHASSVIAIAKEMKDKSSDKTAVGVSSKLIKNGTSVGTGKSEIVTAFNIETFYKDKEIDCSTLTNTEVSEEDILIDKLKYVFFGEIGSDPKALKHITRYIDSTSCEFKSKEVAENIKQAMTTGNGSILPIPKYVAIPALITEPSDAAKALVYGVERIEGKNQYITNSKITIPNRDCIYLDLPLGKNTAGQSLDRERFIYISSEKKTSTMNLTWNGAFLESLKGIELLVDASTGNNYRLSVASSYSEYSTSTTEATLETISTPLLIPSIQKYIGIISKLEQRAKGETFRTKILKVNLAKINAIYFAEGLMSSIESRVVELLNGSEGNAFVVNGYLKKIRSVSKEVAKLLAVMREEIAASDLTKEFRDLETMQRTESIKGVQN